MRDNREGQHASHTVRSDRRDLARARRLQSRGAAERLPPAPARMLPRLRHPRHPPRRPPATWRRRPRPPTASGASPRKRMRPRISGINFIAFNRTGKTVTALAIRPEEGEPGVGTPEGSAWSPNVLAQRELPDASPRRISRPIRALPLAATRDIRGPPRPATIRPSTCATRSASTCADLGSDRSEAVQQRADSPGA